MFFFADTEDDGSQSVESYSALVSSPHTTLCSASSPVSTASAPVSTALSVSVASGSEIISGLSSAPLIDLSGLELPVSSSASADQIPCFFPTDAVPSVADAPTLSTAPAVSPSPAPIFPGNLTAPVTSVCSTTAVAHVSSPPLLGVMTSAMEQQQALTQVATPITAQSQQAPTTHPLQASHLEKEVQQTAPQHQGDQEQTLLLHEQPPQQFLQQLQQRQLMEKQMVLHQQLTEVQTLPIPGNTETLHQSVPVHQLLPQLPGQQTQPQQPLPFAPQLPQQPQLQPSPQQVIAPLVDLVTQQQEQQQQLNPQQTKHLQQQLMQLQQQQHQLLSAAAQNQLLSSSVSQQLVHQQAQLNVTSMPQQQIPHQNQVPAELCKQSQNALQHPEQQHEMVKATDTAQKQQQFSVQKQSSLQMSESEVSAGETSVAEDNSSYSATFHPSSDSSLPPLPLASAEAHLPNLSLTMTPSPAQPSSVAESDSEGPPKMGFVDNRIKTLDEKLRNLLYQEYNSGTTHSGAASAPVSATSTSAGGDESSEPQSLQHSSFHPPTSSSDTSPHSSSSTTPTTTTPRSSSTSPDPERGEVGKEAMTGLLNLTQLSPVEQQPCPSLPSTSASSTLHSSLVPPSHDSSAGPQCPNVSGEPTVFVSKTKDEMICSALNWLHFIVERLQSILFNCFLIILGI